MDKQMGSAIAPENLDAVLSSGTNAGQKGQSQFFTPQAFGKLACALLPEQRNTVVDLMCGAGHLLVAASNKTTQNLLGIDIDGCRTLRAANGVPVNKITGDLTEMYPLLHEVDWVADLFVLNPAWGINLFADRIKDQLAGADLLSVRQAIEGVILSRKETIDSTMATMMIALDRMTRRGEGLLIANQSTIDRLICHPDAPYRVLRQHIWAHFVLAGNPMTGEDGHQWGNEFNTALVYFARSHSLGPQQTGACANVGELEDAIRSTSRLRARYGECIAFGRQFSDNTVAYWDATRSEIQVRQKEKEKQRHGHYNIWLDHNGVLQTHLSVFQNRSYKIDKTLAESLHKLNGQRPMQLVVQKQQREDLQKAVNGSIWRVHPDVPAAIEHAIWEYHSVRAPLYPLSRVQCLGYLDEQDSIVCTKDFVGTSDKLTGIKIVHSAQVALRAYINAPSQTTWENAAHFAAISGGDTIWQFANRLDPEFYAAHDDAGFDGVGRDGLKLKAKPCTPDGKWRVLPDPEKLKPLLTGRILFRAGQSYPLRTQSMKVQRTEQKPGIDGELHDILLTGQELGIFVKNESGEEAGFMDSRHKDKLADSNVPVEYTLQQLLEHFEIPTVPDVAALNPQRWEFYREELRGLERQTQRKLKGFQMDDISRAALNDGLIMAWDTGLGKTWAMFLWPLVKVGRKDGTMEPKGRICIVAPEFLHDQIIEEGRSKFGITNIVRLDSQATYAKLAIPGRGLPDGWYISSFTQMASNKVEKLPNPLDENPTIDRIAQLMQFYGVTFEMAKSAKIQSSIPLSTSQRGLELCRQMYLKYSEGVGTSRNGIRCIYSAALADLVAREFDCVAVDEAVRIKGEYTQIGLGIRSLCPRFRLVLTATPIKNRLPDIFWLAWWAAGGKAEAHARWPYANKAGEQMIFASEFLVAERDLTLEKRKAAPGGPTKKKKKKQIRGKVTAEVCNIHRLWKLVAPVILRRRKRDIGEDIVPKVRKPIRVPMGAEQAAVYKYHMMAPYKDKNDKPAILAKMQALRTAAAAPHSVLLNRIVDDKDDGRLAIRNALEFDSPDVPFRSDNDYTPKLAATLRVILWCLQNREQVCVFSAFTEPLLTIARRLDEARLGYYLMTGEQSALARGKMSADFKKGCPHAKPVVLAGLKAMAEGNDWPLANNVVLPAFDWAYDLFEQGINRVHRLTSPRKVNVWSILCDGTIDWKLDNLIDEKGDACELVLDGKLTEEEREDVNLHALLDLAVETFSDKDTICEKLLRKQWPALREELQRAHRVYRGWEDAGDVVDPSTVGRVVRLDDITDIETGDTKPEPEPETEMELVLAGVSVETVVDVIQAPTMDLMDW